MRTPIRDLHGDAIDAKPVDFDWAEGYGEAWDYTEACYCSECNAVVIGREGDRHCDVDSESECKGGLSGEGPMMNYWYPLRIADEAAAARAIVDLPLCVVRIGDATGLALTGGGMDLSWEICEAFMLLGELPPVHFAGLPAMCGRGLSARDRWIAAGCRKAFQVAASRARYGAKKVREALAFARRHEADRQAAAAAT